MSLELFLTIVGTGVAIIIAIVSGYWALGKLVLSQFDKRLEERFAAQEKTREEGRKIWETRFHRYEEDQRRLERSFMEFQAIIPRDYWRREDAIRNDTMIDAKLDAMNARLDHVLTQLRPKT